MLSKEICKQCISHIMQELGKVWDGNALVESSKPKWTEFDEERWKRQSIICLGDFPNNIPLLCTKGEPPEYCKYFFEHILETQKC